ncbi:MAG: hypothetical protein JXB88_16230 [Spirochaetales bacterium]|nr:hypothetical protein [Spirochaetales bacterium]
MEMTWEQAKEEIDKYIIIYFQKIEWYYGDNRAPFAYPPRFSMNREDSGSFTYTCELVMEDPGSENIIMEEETPSLLFKRVKEEINSQFMDFESKPE